MALALLLDLRSVHGTATNFPALELSLGSEEVGDGEVDVVLGLPEEVLEITAKSILPEDGFNTKSVIEPTVWP